MRKGAGGETSFPRISATHSWTPEFDRSSRDGPPPNPPRKGEGQVLSERRHSKGRIHSGRLSCVPDTVSSLPREGRVRGGNLGSPRVSPFDADALEELVDVGEVHQDLSGLAALVAADHAVLRH